MCACTRLRLHESIGPDGALESVWLELLDDALSLRAGGAPPTAFDERVLGAIMRRFGRPLADDVLLPDGAEMRLPSGARLWPLRFLPRYDVIAKDYLVYQAGDEGPLVELATAVSAALSFVIARRTHGAGDGG